MQVTNLHSIDLELCVAELRYNKISETLDGQVQISCNQLPDNFIIYFTLVGKNVCLNVNNVYILNRLYVYLTNV